MSKPFGQFYTVFAIFLVAFTVGCSTSSSPKKDPGGVQFVNPTSSPTIDQGQSVNVTVSTSDASSVTWSLQAGFGTPKGKLSNQTATSATYTAPATVSQETQVTIVATSGTASAALAVFIMPAPQQPAWLNGGMPTVCPANGTVLLPGGSPTVSQVGQALAVGSGGLSLTVTGGVRPYAWSLASGSLPGGLTLAVGTDTSQPAFVGTPITSGCSSFAVKVTDAVGVSVTSETLYMVVVPPALKVITPTFHAALVDASGNGVPYIPATMLASAGTPPYTWSVSGNSPQNTFPTALTMTSSGLVTGVPSATNLTQNGGLGVFFPQLLVSDSQSPYPAAAEPAPTIQVTNETSSCPSGFESYLKAQGSYAFQLRGFDANGPVTLAGNFVVNGAGNITGGNEDISRVSGSESGLTLEAGSSYSLDQANRGCVTLVNSAGTTTVFRIAMGGCSTGRDANGADCLVPQGGGSYYFTSGRMVEFDDSTGSGTRASGIVRLEDSSTFQNSGINGMYAFGLSGWDPTRGRFAMAGSATASSGSWGSSVAADTNDAGTASGEMTGGSGSFSIATNGRGTGTISIGNLSLHVVLYPVSSHEVLIATVGPPSATNPMLTGEAISTAGPFSQQSLENSHIFHLAGVSTAGPDPSIGTIAFDGTGGFSGVEYENQAGTLSTVNLSGSYSPPDQFARFAFSATGTQNLGLHPLVGYVIPLPGNLSFPTCITRAACISGFLVSTDSTAQAGVLEFQTPTVAPPPPFSVTSLEGTYVFGTDETLDPKTLEVSGRGNAKPTGPTVDVIEESSYSDPNYCLVSNCVLLIPGDQATLSYTVNNDGSGKFGGQSVSVTNGEATFYLDESPLNLHPSVVVVEQ